MLENLVSNPMYRVAILSSRMLEDLIPRVEVPGLFLGGSSGIEWQVPSGHRMTLSGAAATRPEVARKRVLPELLVMARMPGVEIEDKKWSVALHTRNASTAMKLILSDCLSHWRPAAKVRILKGPEVFEVQFVPRINKSFGVRTLCKFLKFRPYPDGIVYAGDDENDAMAMRLIARLGGTAITVGDHPLIPSSKVVKDQKDLAEEVCTLMSL